MRCRGIGWWQAFHFGCVEDTSGQMCGGRFAIWTYAPPTGGAWFDWRWSFRPANRAAIKIKSAHGAFPHKHSVRKIRCEKSGASGGKAGKGKLGASAAIAGTDVCCFQAEWLLLTLRITCIGRSVPFEPSKQKFVILLGNPKLVSGQTCLIFQPVIASLYILQTHRIVNVEGWWPRMH